MRASTSGHLVVVALVGFLLAGTARGQTIIYVDGDLVGGDDDGTSWSNAHADLQKAIDPGQHSCSSGNQCEVWVKEGTYKPDSGDDQGASFELRDFVQIYGGFAGGETQRDQRDWMANETILSGDLQGDDDPGFGDRGDNTRNVVLVEGTDRNNDPRLDGFTVSGGSSLVGEPGAESGGGGIRFVVSQFGGSAKIYNCTITDNEAENGGGGIYLADSAGNSDPWIVNCLISDNRADHGGGIGGKATGSPLIINCAIVGNEATSAIFGGGGVQLEGPVTPTFQNCLIADNLASPRFAQGGGMAVRAGAGPLLINTTFADNVTGAGGQGGGLFVDSGSTANIDNSIFWNNSATDGPEIYVDGIQINRVLIQYTDVLTLLVVGDGVSYGDGNIQQDPLFVLGAYSLQQQSPCIDAASRTLVRPDETDVDDDTNTTELTPDLDLVERDVGCLVDMGAYEYPVPVVGIAGALPADGTHDARQPHPKDDNSFGARQGIGSPNTYTDGPEPIQITLTRPVSGADRLECWELCETGIEEVEGIPDLQANQIYSVTETSAGVYEIRLDRPISGGHWTTITYVGDGSRVSYASLPADVNASRVSNGADILDLIDYLNGVKVPPYGNYSTNIDHSEVFNLGDIVTEIDLLDGVDTFIVWNKKSLAGNTCIFGGGGSSHHSGDPDGGGAVDEDQAFADGFVIYLTTTVVSEPEEVEEFSLIVEALTGWCVGEFSGPEREALAERLQDPLLEFASPTAEEMVPGIVASLLE